MTPRPDFIMRALILAALFVSGAALFAQPKPRKFTSCDPITVLRTSPNKRDTLKAWLPCADTAKLYPAARAQITCTVQRMQKGGWSPRIFETYRSNERQQYLYSYGRTRPGPRVTNAKDASKSMHGSGMAVDIIDAKRHWDHPRFFHWLMIHAESCGAVSGGAWARLPDYPHVQYGLYAGPPPQWMQERKRAGVSVDSIWKEQSRRAQ
jgi:hypothetical protein